MPLSPPALPDWIQEQLPKGLKRQMVDVGDASMHVVSKGEGRPVVLVHGNPTWSFLYRKVFAQLDGAPYRLIAPDLVGLGLSTRVPFDAHTLDNHGRWMKALVHALDLRDVILVVQDWGGPIGALGFVDEPDRVAGLVVLNTVIGPPKPGFKATAFHRFSQMPVVSTFAFRVLGYPQVALHTAQGDKSSIRGDVARAYTWPLKGRAKNAAPLAMARMVPDRFTHPSIASLERVGGFYRGFEGPAAVVWGDRDPVLGKVRSHVQRTLPQAKSWVTQAGHFLQEEVPEEIAAGIRHVGEALS